MPEEGKKKEKNHRMPLARLALVDDVKIAKDEVTKKMTIRKFECASFAPSK